MKELTYYLPTRIFFGCGAINKLKEVKLPGKKALLVISSGTSMRKFGYLDKLTKILDEINVEYVIYDKVIANPIIDHVMEGAKIAKDNNCEMVIALGGGSTIDCAKAMAVMTNNPGDYWDYINGGTGKGMAIPNPALPIIAITTTAGTGTEADPWTVVTKNEEKIGFGYDGTFPTISVVDPELMTSVPKNMTAYQGFDALFHSAEGYIASCANPVSEALSIKAIELIGKWLPVAIKEPDNIEARGNVAYANSIAGMVETFSCCTSEHSMAHAISGVYPNVPHGAALISICISYFSFFVDGCPEKLGDMARALGADISGMSKKEAAEAFVKKLQELKEACGVGTIGLKEFGVDPNKAEYIAQNSIDTMGGLYALDCKIVTLADATDIIAKSM